MVKYSILSEQNNGGMPYAYRLRVSESRPDFDLRVVPSEISIPRRGTAKITIHAIRRDGFDGQIDLSIKDTPGGAEEFSLSSTIIPADKDKVLLTISASQKAQPETFTMQIEGSADIDGKKVKHTAVPAEDMMQAFLYRHLVPSKDMVVTVSKRWGATIIPDLPEDGILKIPYGGEVELVMNRIRPKKVKKSLILELDNPPPGITIKDSNTPHEDSRMVIILIADDEETKAGMKGNLILTRRMGKNKNKFSWVLPAIPFEVVE